MLKFCFEEEYNGPLVGMLNEVATPKQIPVIFVKRVVVESTNGEMCERIDFSDLTDYKFTKLMRMYEKIEEVENVHIFLDHKRMTRHINRKMKRLFGDKLFYKREE